MPIPFRTTFVTVQRPATPTIGSLTFATIYTNRAVKIAMGGSWDTYIPEGGGPALHKGVLYDDLNSDYRAYDLITVAGQRGQATSITLPTWRVHRTIQRSGRLRHLAVPILAVPVPLDGLPDTAIISRRSAPTTDQYGGPVETYTTYATLPCRLYPDSGAALEQTLAERMTSTSPWLVEFAPGTTVLVTDHLVINARTFEAKNVDGGMSYEMSTVAHCVEIT